MYYKNLLTVIQNVLVQYELHSNEGYNQWQSMQFGIIKAELVKAI